ncbi:helix-hairpin-helix domain-containing protein [Virgibacillus doumboii]|uniref:helix-hairpin-helix domain-containing protein n=1 Tax=Virgibacillus doumboii TaxID=2697503 RepID=UPI0013DF5B1C|nr:helix-hairpin-helix domain-containing protein [Virgibacillus doumboii]
MFELLKRNIFLIVIVISIIIFLFVNNDDSDKIAGESNIKVKEIPIAETSEPKQKQPSSLIVVDVKGEVVRPGVYKMEPESRVNSVIQMAGGFTEDADQTMVNLAQKVQDEMLIVVPKIGEVTAAGGNVSTNNDKLRINYATQEEIEILNGIGPAKAQAIVQYREENGFFKTVDDLLEVSGIGEKTLENLKEDIQVP